MGLEYVEFVLAIEQRFGVRLADEAVSKCETVGDLARLLRSTLSAQEGREVTLGLDEVVTGLRTIATAQYELEDQPVEAGTRLVELFPWG